MAFHWKHGWYFSRLSDGSVEVRNHGDYNKPDPNHAAGDGRTTLVIPPEEWASIVASVSKSGETSESYHGTLAFHTGSIPYPSPGRPVPPHGSGPDNQ